MSVHRESKAVLVRAGALAIGLALTAAAVAGCGASSGARPDVSSTARASAHAVVAQPALVTRPVLADGPTSPAKCPAAAYGARHYAPGTGKTVALTFDDGPGRSTDAILGILRRYRVPATFFNIGQAMATRPYLVRDEVRAGFAMGNHSWSHPHLTMLSAALQGAQLSRASAEQHLIAGTVPCAFRPPFGEYDATTLLLAQQRHLGVWLWSNDTLDWKANGSGSAYWVQRVIRLAEQGSALSHPILLMHNARGGDPATVSALPAIIRYFQARGYRFVAL
jgi:peptidoglycan/xylan/chitin deacetylase (PgdA/CDA1 family)